MRRRTEGTGATSAGAGAGPFRRLAELLALTAVAVAQPVLDVTGRAPDFFLYRRANPNEMRLFVALVTLLPPLAAWALELAVGVVSRRAARALHVAVCAGLFAVVAVQAGKQLGLFTGVPLGVLAVAVGVALAYLLVRVTGFRQAVRYAAPAPVVFALLFTFGTPAGALVRGAGEVDRGEGRFVANRPPIVYVFLDEFPLRALLDGEGRIDEARYPSFARLARMSTWYPNATGVTGWTPFAAPAMLNGRYPQRAVAASYIEYPETLFTLLASSYELRAYETIGELCPPGLCKGVAAGRETGMRALARETIALTLDLVSPYPPKRNVTTQFVENAVEVAREQAKGKKRPGAMDRFDEAARNQPERMGPFLRDLTPLPDPSLHFMHLLLPHAPYRYLPSGTAYEPTPVDWPPERLDPSKPKQTTIDDPVWSTLTKQRLLMQTAYLDNQLGALLDRMRDTGLLDQALLVVTADHGTGIEPRAKLRQLDDGNAADIAWVPTFVKTPGQREGKVDDRNALAVDLVPTIADVLDVTVPWPMDGVSLLGPPRPTAEKPWYDVPGQRKTIDPARWRPVVRRGYAAEIARPGRRGLFAVGPHADLVGKPVAGLTLGAPSPVTADLHEESVPLGDVDPATGTLPAAVFGDLDRPVGAEPGWLVASVNGTIAGVVGAMPADGRWRFAGVLDDATFRPGRNDVALYEVRGTTLHRLTLVP